MMSPIIWFHPLGGKMYQMGDVIHGLELVVIPYYAIKKVVWVSWLNDVTHFLISPTQGETRTKGPFTWSMCSKVLKKSMDFENLAVVFK